MKKVRTLDENLGLNPSNLHKSGIAVGFLPAFGEPFASNTPREINAKLPAPMAIVGDYVDLKTSDPNLSSIDKSLEVIRGLEGNPVWELALMPNEGLDKITKEVAVSISKKMLWINNQGITVWMRFAHEMNGDWYSWGLQPEKFIEKWRLIAHEVKSRTQKTYMLWAPNSAFGESLDSVRGGYTKYWPGADTVDISGLSFYHYGGFERLNVLLAPGEAVSKIKEFAQLYGSAQNRPVILSETGASYTTSISTGKPAWGGGSEYDIKYQWLQQLLSSKTREEIPNLKAIAWFEVFKHETAAGNSPLKAEDFRLILGDQGLSHDAIQYLSEK
ncbi:hypothetical protein O181_059838 [Austropuccinia psidii MF-1]|uniref:GH26 domain-containing protein n=1 Tax=Austropuccinia psidii MF-1 TaxID=1389203 RepID=A0A9Q3EJK3_9BASI|nr:hypothetical protein [Austropuccinia psidii MF-1]